MLSLKGFNLISNRRTTVRERVLDLALPRAPLLELDRDEQAVQVVIDAFNSFV